MTETSEASPAAASDPLIERDLLYLQDTGGDENFLLHAVTLESSETRNLAPFEDTTVDVTYIGPDHPDTILVGLNNRDPRFHDVHRLTLSTGEHELIERNEGFLGYLAGDDLRVRLAFAPRQGGGLDVLRKDGDGFAHLLTIEQEDDMVTQPVTISPDGQHVHMIDSRNRDTGALARIHLQSGEHQIVASDERADVAGVFVDIASPEFTAYAVNYKKPEWVPLHDDLLDAVAWAGEKGITRREQVAFMGGSCGDYATLAGLAFTPDVFACGVDIVGPSNLETLLASIPPYWKAFFENLATRVGDPRTEEGLALLRERSALHSADGIMKPLLIAQGANDPRVKQAESDQIVQAMLGNKLPVTYVLYPDEGHGFAQPQNRLAFYGIAEAFLAECLGRRHQALADALDGSSTEVPTGAEFISGLQQALADFEPVVTH